MNYNEIGLYKFFLSLTYDEHFKLSDSEMYSYIKTKTDNFDLETFKLFRSEVNKLSGLICFVLPQGMTNEKCDEEITLIDFFKKHIIEVAIFTFKYENENLNNEKFLTLFKDYKNSLAKYEEFYIEEYDAKMKMQEIQLYYKEYDFGLFERYSQIIRFSDLLFSIYERLFTKDTALYKIPKLKIKSKKPLTFYQLFKDPFNKNLEKFKKILLDSNLIDDKFQWRETDNNGKKLPKNDIGKFYNWLYNETTVFDKSRDKTAHCICFCNEFGITPYEGKKNKHRTGRTVTAKLIRETTFDNELELKYNTYFKTWINKQK